MFGGFVTQLYANVCRWQCVERGHTYVYTKLIFRLHHTQKGVFATKKPKTGV